jgi:hypothetical protein
LQGRFILENQHAEVLKMACLAADEVAFYGKAIEQDGLVLKGSQGQPIAHCRPPTTISTAFAITLSAAAPSWTGIGRCCSGIALQLSPSMRSGNNGEN